MEFVVFIVMFIFTLIFVPAMCLAQQFEAPKASTVSAKHDSTTTFTYKDHGVVYPVYKGKRGGYYIWRKGIRNPKKMCKVAIPKDVQIKMGRKYND